MPQYRATKTFGTERSRFGTIRTGMIVTMSENDAAKFNRANPGVLVEYRGPKLEAAVPGAPNNAAVPGAPRTKDAPRPEPPKQDDDLGKDDRQLDDSEQDPETPDLPAGGRGKLSSAALRGRASRRKT